MQYVRDYDEEMPTLAHNWPVVFNPYVKNLELFDCPAPNTSYAMHARLGGISISFVDKPDAMPLAFDSTRNRLGLWGSDVSWPARGVHRNALRGPSGANTLYFDGHVKWSALKPPFNGKVLRPQVLQARWTFQRMRDIGRSPSQ
jgi:prepilin-type processing-associated H-X9-DG protein